jgi:hypothetical protein
MRIKYNGHILTKAGLVGSAAYTGEQPAPSLPAYTLRLKFTEGVTPTFSKGTGVQVSSSPNIWDLTYENDNWYRLLFRQTDLVEVIAGNTTDVVYMNSTFQGCSSLISVQLLDTSNIDNMSYAFQSCSSLTAIPLFNISKLTNMGYMFYNCYLVQTGALAFYQQASSKITEPNRYSNAFTNCGRDTVTGAAELAQIPTSWGGTME